MKILKSKLETGSTCMIGDWERVCVFVCLCAEDGNTSFIFVIRYVNQLGVSDALLCKFTVRLL